MAFEQYSHQRALPDPMVSIRETGDLAFNKSAVNVLGLRDTITMSHILLFYDADSDRIGFRPINATINNAPDALKIAYEKSGAAHIRAKGFFEKYSININLKFKYTVHYDQDEALYILHPTTIPRKKRIKKVKTT